MQATSGNGNSGGDFDFEVLFLFGDANGDYVVDFSDLGIVLNNYDNHSGTATLSIGDVNGDGNVDFTDLGIVLNNYYNSIYPHP
jgi:hypothetical protein